MMVGRGDLFNQSEVRGDEPRCFVGEVPRLPGRLNCGEWLVG